MNEELTLAVDEYRKMPPGRTWLIPIRLEEVAIPEWELGAGATLSDLNYIDLFGESFAAQAVSLTTTISRLMGDVGPSASTTIAAVEEMQDAARVEHLRRLTKEMLPDPRRRIELDDLIVREVQGIVNKLEDEDAFSSRRAGGGGTDKDWTLSLVETSTRLQALAQPFCASLQVAARWGSAEEIAPWAVGIQRLVASANRTRGGNVALLNLRHIPALFAITTAALSCCSAGRWASLRTLLVEPTVSNPYRANEVAHLLEVTDPYKPFEQAEMTAQVLARTAMFGAEPADAYDYYDQRRGGKLHTPVAEWLHSTLRPIFSDSLPDQDQFDSAFDSAELFLGLLSQDMEMRRQEQFGNTWPAHTRWMGRSTWRASHGRTGALDEIVRTVERQGASWAPVRHGLFDSDVGRVRSVIEAFSEDFQRTARNRF